MAYLIDGHNLIPKIAGLSLSAIDDEQELINRLQAYCRRERKTVEVFFDQAPPGFAGTRAYGAVKAHFVRKGRTADEAIRLRLSLARKSCRRLDRGLLGPPGPGRGAQCASPDFLQMSLPVCSHQPG